MFAKPHSLRWLARWSVLMWIALPLVAVAQNKGGGFGDFGFPNAAANGPKVSFQASYEVEQDAATGRIHVTADIVDGWHMYSTTQPKGGPLPTVIEVPGELVQLSGPFVPDHAPDVSENDVWPGLPIEEQHGKVIWTAPFKLTKEFEPEKTSLAIALEGSVCTSDGSCIPVSEKLEAKFSGTYGGVEKKQTLRVEDTQAVWTASLEPSQVQPGESLVLSLKAELDAGYHLYPFVPGKKEVVSGAGETSFRTLIVPTTKSGLKFGEPQTAASLEYDNRLDDPIAYHPGTVEWKIPVRVPANAAAGAYPIEMQVGFVTCDDKSCSPNSGLMLTGQVMVGPQTTAAPTALDLSEVSFEQVAGQPMLTSWIDAPAAPPASDQADAPQSLTAGGSLELWMVFAALAGGFILNFMPCVLPVIGLKLMSFVNQSGSNHSRVVGLNLAYVSGILAVMLILALVTVLAKVIWGSAFGWGEQFTVLEFKVALAVLVFAMALSFLGVWEIPIPGFATSSTSGDLMDKEGPWGAFLKGVLTTILATPCSGPLLGSLFGLSLTLSPLHVILLYLIVGFGMSIPYLALCIYPGAIRMLPKPGAWMETLKQALAFPLLLTAVFFVASIDSDHRIATLILLIVVWFACWLIGRVPAYAERHRVRGAWFTGLATIAVGAVVSFGFFGPVHSDLPWVPYNEAQLTKFRQEGKTVMIDFTANWCLNCQINTRVAIDKKRVAALVAENDVVPMLADWTGRSDEIRSKLDDLNSNSIPLLAIYPADPTAEPILLRDLLTESQVLEALKQAGPSQPKSKLASRPLN